MKAQKMTDAVIQKLPSGTYALFHPVTESLIATVELTTNDTLETLYPIRGCVLHKHQLYDYAEYKEEIEWDIDGCVLEECWIVPAGEVKFWLTIGGN